MDTILQIFFSPGKAFSELKRENKFPVMAFVILLLLLAVNYILMVPITSKVMEVTMSLMPMQMPEKQFDAMMSMMHKLRYLMVIGNVFTIAIFLFIYALILYVITVIFKPAITYVKAFTLIIYSYFAILIGELINTGILYMRGLENITSPFEVMFTGLNLFTTIEETGAGIYTLLCLINPFQILFMVLLSIGLKIFADIKYIKALLICFIFWLITIIIPIGSAIFSEIAMNKAGLM